MLYLSNLMTYQGDALVARLLRLDVGRADAALDPQLGLQVLTQRLDLRRHLSFFVFGID